MGILALLLGAAGALFKLPTLDGADVVASGASSATLALNSNGTYSVATSGGTVESGNWVTPTGLAPGAHTIRVHVNSGTNPTGSGLDSDLALSSNRSWTIARATAGTTAANITLTLKSGAGATLKTSTINLSAQTLL